MSCPSLFWQPNWQLAYVPCRVHKWRWFSVFPALSLCSYSVGQSFIYFPSLTGSKPACIIGDTGRDRPVVVVSLWKLVHECCTLVITYCCIYVRTLQGWFSPSRPKINLFAFTFSSSGVKILENCLKKSENICYKLMLTTVHMYFAPTGK